MKISLSLIKKYIDIDLPVSQIADILTMAGLEVDGIINETSTFSNVICAEVISTQKHPNADSLCIANVNDGKEVFQVVCGAKNCREKIKVAFAKIGAEIKTEDGKVIKIKKGKLRQIESFGMLCSAQELGLSDSEDGIIELDNSFEIGQNLENVFLNPIFEISLTPNLGHCSSALGIARELAALLDKKIKKEKINLEYSNKKTSDLIDVSVKEKDLIPRYSCIIVENVNTKATIPLFIKKELKASGLRSINPIVDIMNYVMLELGQPLHGFDYDLLDGKKIEVTTNLEKQDFVCLDNQTREIPKNAIIIKDEKKPVAIAGIIGGNNSAVSDSTKTILIESATFNPISIRQTSNILNLRTDSTLLFEKATDANITIFALEKAAFLVQQICNGKVTKDPIDIKRGDFILKKIKCRTKRANQILGLKLSVNEIVSIFKRLCFNTKVLENDEIEVEIPTYRNDISLEIDLIEEIARIYGYNNIKQEISKYRSTLLDNDPIYVFEKLVKSSLVKCGLCEMITSDLISPNLVSLLHKHSNFQNQFIEVLHSKSEHHCVLRPSLLPNLIEVVKTNANHSSFNIAGFEIGKIHFKQEDLFVEQSKLAIVITGQKNPKSWDGKDKNFDFYDLKAILQSLFTTLHIDEIDYEKTSDSIYHPHIQAKIFNNKKFIGSIGQVHPNLLINFDIKKDVYYCQLDMMSLFNFSKSILKVKPLSQYPSSSRDWTISLKKQAPIGNILKILESYNSQILENINLLDIYEDETLSQNKKNATIRFVFRNNKKTISYDEVEKEFLKITNFTKEKINTFLI
jgi:phenylalanyl-tRNA synthetase beta chain